MTVVGACRYIGAHTAIQPKVVIAALRAAGATTEERGGGENNAAKQVLRTRRLAQGKVQAYFKNHAVPEIYSASTELLGWIATRQAAPVTPTAAAPVTPTAAAPVTPTGEVGKVGKVGA